MTHDVSMKRNEVFLADEYATHPLSAGRRRGWGGDVSACKADWVYDSDS